MVAISRRLLARRVWDGLVLCFFGRSLLYLSGKEAVVMSKHEVSLYMDHARAIMMLRYPSNLNVRELTWPMLNVL